MLAVPKAEGKYPALLRVPGAGVRPYEAANEMAAKWMITFKIGIHDIPVNMDPEVYEKALKIQDMIINGEIDPPYSEDTYKNFSK